MERCQKNDHRSECCDWLMSSSQTAFRIPFVIDQFLFLFLFLSRFLTVFLEHLQKNYHVPSSLRFQHCPQTWQHFISKAEGKSWRVSPCLRILMWSPIMITAVKADPKVRNQESWTPANWLTTSLYFLNQIEWVFECWDCVSSVYWLQQSYIIIQNNTYS